MPNNPIDAYVGMRLKIKRNELGLSQNKVGELTGVTFQQIQKYEKGLNRIGSSRLYEFAKILKVPVSYFFERYELTIANRAMFSDSQDHFQDKDAVSDKEIVLLIKTFSSIKNPLSRKTIISLAKNLSKQENSDEK